MQVKEDQIGEILGGALRVLERVRYRDFIAFQLQEGRKGASKCGVVIHDQKLKPTISHGNPS